VLAKPFVTHERELTGMHNVGGELRGEGTFKPTAVQAVPCHLLENSLVVSSQKNPGFPQLQSEHHHGKQARCQRMAFDPAAPFPSLKLVHAREQQSCPIKRIKQGVVFTIDQIFW